MALRQCLQRICTSLGSSISRPTKSNFRLSANMVTSVSQLGVDGHKEVHTEKLKRLVTDISQLSLLEASQLNELLKSTLNLSDYPVSTMDRTHVVKEMESETVKEESKLYTVKLMKYVDNSKIKLIKEVKSLVEGMNLVQAKKFVEAVPQVIQRDVSKEGASKLKASLEAAGGIVELE